MKQMAGLSFLALDLGDLKTARVAKFNTLIALSDKWNTKTLKISGDPGMVSKCLKQCNVLHLKRVHLDAPRKALNLRNSLDHQPRKIKPVY
ncbi:hypothetical protein FBEOM_8788 [Fusarium beomiforme]|uniref:Uncharacterized protein n=1 Tax=Fusarium beomiforme TaxID=44412 RepID=A0A9P5AEU8_9HYPO|nr:hypothetical protein FBEOM_8788 [Fusarium beomiforme]